MREEQDFLQNTAQQSSAPHIPPITVVEIDAMFLHIMRCPAVRSDAMRFLLPEFFDAASEPHYTLLWTTIRKLSEEFGHFNFEMLATRVLTVVEGQSQLMISPDLIDQVVRGDQRGIIWAAMAVPEEQLHIPFGQQILQRFLQERGVLRRLRMILAGGFNGSYIEQFPHLVRSAAQALDSIATLTVTLDRSPGEPVLIDLPRTDQ